MLKGEGSAPLKSRKSVFSVTYTHTHTQSQEKDGKLQPDELGQG